MKKNPLYKSFGYAFQGIGNTIRSERNIKIHLTVMTLVIVFGIFLHLSVTEWFVCLILFGQVISLELVNTAIEAAVDLATKEKHPLAKKAKDAAAEPSLCRQSLRPSSDLSFLSRNFCTAVRRELQISRNISHCCRAGMYRQIRNKAGADRLRLQVTANLL